MPVILATADWQCATANLHACEATLNHITRLIKRHRVNAVLHLGDLKESFNPVDQRVTNFLVHATREICQHVPFGVLVGNHDRINTSDESESCLPAMRAAGAWTFEAPGYFSLGSGYQAFMVPFFRDSSALLKVLRDAAPENPGKTLLAFHAEIAGCKLSMVPGVPTSKSAIPLEGLWPDNYLCCLGGHIHHQQQLRDNVWYVGSPFHHDWREANHSAGFLLIETKPFKVTRIPSRLPGYWDPAMPGFDPERTQGAQVRIRVPYQEGQDLKKLQEEAEEQYPGAIIHLRIGDQPEEKVSSIELAQDDVVTLGQYLSQAKVAEAPAVQAYILHKLRRFGTGMVGLPKLTFNMVRAMNVLSFERATLPLSGKGVTLITGENRDWQGRSNGSGKTSLLGLPIVALVGESPKGQSHDSWARQSTQETSWVELTMRLPDGREMKVTRGRRPGRLKVEVGGKDLSGTINGTQRLIESLTCLSPSVIYSALFVGQREVNTILSGTPRERKDLFANFLGLGRFLQVEEAVRKDLSKAARAFEGVGGEIGSISDQKTRVIEDMEEFVKKLDGQPSADDCRIKVETLEEELKQKEARLATLRKKKAEADAAVMKAMEATTTILSDRVGVDGEARWLRGKLKGVGRLKVLTECPECGSTIQPEVKDRLKKGIEKKLADLESKLQDLDKEFRKANAVVGETEKASNEVTKRVQVLAEDVSEARHAIDGWKLRLGEAVRSAEVVDRYRKQIRDLDRRGWLAAGYSTYLDKYITFLERCLKVVGRDGLPAYLCANACPSLNTAAMRYSELFSDGAIQVRFVSNEGELDITVENRFGGEAIQDQSQGEMRMAGLISAFAIRDVLVPYNLLILDEPGEGLDAMNARTFAAALKTVSERFGALFIVTHNPSVVAELEPERHLHVVKEDGVSRVEVKQ